MSKKGGLPLAIRGFLILSLSLGFFCLQMLLASLTLWRSGQILYPNVVQAASQGDILINEIMYALPGPDDKHEWVELYNNGSSQVDLTGWKFNDGNDATNHKINTITDSKTPSRGSLILDTGGYALLADDAATLAADLPNYRGTIIDTALSLSDKGATLKLLNKDGMEIATAQYNKEMGAYNNGKTLEWDGAMFKESLIDGGTPGAVNTLLQPYPSEGEAAQCGNGKLETGEQCDDGNLINGDGCSSTCQTETAIATTTLPQVTSPQPSPYQGEEEVRQNNLGDVVINEFVSDPGDNDVEWVELYNTTNREINLTDWTIEDGSKAKTDLTGQLGSAGNSRFFIIEKPKGALNNSGDVIILRDGADKIIDQVSYGNWDDGNKDNNAPAASDPNSVARIFDGQNSYNNAYDFAVTTKATKGASNVITKESEISQENRANYDYSNDIVISEIFPNPVGPDNPSTLQQSSPRPELGTKAGQAGSGQGEFIEILNKGPRQVNLSGWSLSDNEDKKRAIDAISTSTIIEAGKYLVFYRAASKIVLNNDSDMVKLYQPYVDKAYQTVKYTKAIEGWSYNMAEDCLSAAVNCDWSWSEIVTPGEINKIKTINHAPTVDFTYPDIIIAGQPVIFDSSDTVDEDADELKFSWDFGDGLTNILANPEHTFFKSGTYTVKLTVSDGKDEANKEKIIKVYSGIAEAKAESGLSASSPQVLGTSNLNSVVLNEILPNPVGEDTAGEWIELKNQSDTKTNLLNYRVANSSQKSYSFANNLWLEAGQLYLLKRSESKLVLNNQADTFRLFDDLSVLVDSVTYQDAGEGEAYARGANGKWFWTTVLTPGQENIIEVAQSKNVIKSSQSGIKVNNKIYTEITLDKVKEYEVGDLVKVKGTVAVEPGVLGTQIFYLITLTPDPSPAYAAQERGTTKEAQITGGIQIYNYKKDFPKLKAGDYIEVSGELALSAGESRIKTADKDGIKIIEHHLAPQARTATCDIISEEFVGQLISVTGEVTDRKSSTIYLDDGTDEVQVYLKSLTGIDPKNFVAGDKLTVSGILGRTNTGIRLLPRYLEDLVRVNAANAAEPQVLGEVSASDQWQLEARDKKLELFKYLLIIAGGIIVVLAGLMIKNRKKAN